MSFLAMFAPILIKYGVQYGPQIEQDIVSLLHKQGYTVAQIDAAFADLKPYESFGINPNAPVVPETPPTTPA